MAITNSKKVVKNQVVAYTATPGLSAAFLAQSTLIRVVATSNCHLKFGAAPTATTSDMYLPLGIPEVFQVTPGEKVSVIQNSAGGNLHVTELTS